MKKLLFFLLAVAGPGCLGEDSNQNPIPLSCGSHDQPAGFHVLQTNAEWEGFWANSCSGPQPQVDMGTASVAIRFWGQQPTSGYALELVGTSGDDPTTLHYTLHSPGASCVTAAVLTYPESVAIVPRIEGATRLKDTYVTYECE